MIYFTDFYTLFPVFTCIYIYVFVGNISEKYFDIINTSTWVYMYYNRLTFYFNFEHNVYLKKNNT